MPGVDILGLGRSYADVLLVLPHMPRLDDVLYVEQIGYQGGGVIPTAMAAAARLGVAAGRVGPRQRRLLRRFHHRRLSQVRRDRRLDSGGARLSLCAVAYSWSTVRRVRGPSCPIAGRSRRLPPPISMRSWCRCAACCTRRGAISTSN